MPGQTKQNPYGIIFAEYEGAGVLRTEKGEDVNCRFRVFQLKDGLVVLLCDIVDGPFKYCAALDKPDSLMGNTSQGLVVRAEGLFATNYLPSLRDQRSGTYHAYLAKSLTVEFAQAGTIHALGFALTNVTMAVQESEITHPAGRAILRCLDDYRDTVRHLKTVKGVDVTAELLVDNATITAADTIADDICYLLSLARGTKVQWIARFGYSRTNRQLQWHHASRVTKKYCPFPSIDPRQVKDTDEFLQSAIPTYVIRRDEWNMASGLIDAYLDSKAEADYLETRGVELAVAMEMLKEAFLKVSGYQTLVRPESEFTALAPHLKAAIKDVLTAHDWTGSERATMYGNLAGLNRVSFRDIVTSMCKHLELELPGSDISLFVKCRNSLVHQGRFYCKSATTMERQAVLPHVTPAEEYLWLVHVMDRLFLRLVGYRGPYIDWSDIDNPVRKMTF